MSGKEIFLKLFQENQPKEASSRRVVSERGRKELPPGTKEGENLKPDRHYEHKQYAFDSYCKKVLKCEACNGYRQISRHQKRFTSLEELSEAEMAQLAVYDRYPWEYTTFPVGGVVILIEDDGLAEALLGLSQEDREIFMMHGFLRDINDGIDTIGKKMTVCQLYARQNSHRKNVKRSTEKGREYLMSVLKEDPLGSRSIDSVKLSDAKEWAIRMSEKGYANFLFLNQSGLPKTASCYESMFQGLVRKYNKNHKLEEALPNITPHTMRHTFCTRLAHAGMNPKDLQYIMGHSNITMTLNYYAHADYTSAKAAMDRLAA